jgi:hypothetical protein
VVSVGDSKNPLVFIDAAHTLRREFPKRRRFGAALFAKNGLARSRRELLPAI